MNPASQNHVANVLAMSLLLMKKFSAIHWENVDGVNGSKEGEIVVAVEPHGVDPLNKVMAYEQTVLEVCF
jgi:hypothetical protein